MTTNTPLGLAHIKPEDVEAYKLNYAAHDVGKGLNDVIQYYNKWAQKGTYEQVGKRHVRSTKYLVLPFNISSRKTLVHSGHAVSLL